MSRLITVSRAAQVGETLFFTMEMCVNCGMPFLMLDTFRKERMEDHQSFYCPAGHSQFYSGKTEAQKLREQLEQEQKSHAKELDSVQNMLLDEINTRKKAEKQLKRLHRGVCPCCNRSFENLQRHMKHKHPEAIIPAQ